MNGIDGAENIVDRIFNDKAVNRSLGNFCSHLSSPLEYGSTQAQQQQQQYIISTDAVIRPYSRKGLTLHTSQRRVQLSSTVKSICENCSMYYRVRSTYKWSCHRTVMRQQDEIAQTDHPPILQLLRVVTLHSTALSSYIPLRRSALGYFTKDRAAGKQHGSTWKWGNLGRCQGRCSRGQRRIKWYIR
jgi:hypothetical protein